MSVKKLKSGESDHEITVCRKMVREKIKESKTKRKCSSKTKKGKII